MVRPVRFVVLVAILAAACAVQLTAPSIAHAFKLTQESVQPDGLIVITPDRYEGDVTPGKTLNLGASVLNKTDQPVDISVSITDLAASDDPDKFVDIVKESKYGAANWIQVERPKFHLLSGQQANFNLAVTPPADAPVGANFAGMQVEAVGDASATVGKSTKVAVRIQGLSQLFFTVPGAIKRDTKILHAEISDTFILGGDRFVSYELTFRNDGNVNDHIGGRVQVRSMFGNVVTTLPIRRQVMLRGSTRSTRVVWTNPPWFGRFSAQARMTTDDPSHATITKSFDHVLILPPWWVFALIGGALLIGVGYTVHVRRNSWKKYLDEDWDEDWDDDAELT